MLSILCSIARLGQVVPDLVLRYPPVHCRRVESPFYCNLVCIFLDAGFVMLQFGQDRLGVTAKISLEIGTHLIADPVGVLDCLEGSIARLIDVSEFVSDQGGNR